MKDLAVIMSLYKNDKLVFLKQAVESVLNQSYVDFDFYIQCDGKVSDDCSQYLESIKDNRVFVRLRDENKGLAFSLNEMLTVVREKVYQFIARMDADDICVFDRFQKQITFMQSHTSVDIMGGYIEEINENNEKIQSIQYPCEHQSMKNFFGKRNPLAHMTVMFRSTYFDKAGLYPENTRLDEDTMFWFNGFKNKCEFANIPDVLVKVRVNSDFYGRRNGFVKSYYDFKNRLHIITELNLDMINYLWAFARFVIIGLPFAGLTKLAYKVFRK